MFKKQSVKAPLQNERIEDFSYLTAADIYVDAACQSVRPKKVTEALQNYYNDYNACGSRVSYTWGQRVDEGVQKPAKQY